MATEAPDGSRKPGRDGPRRSALNPAAEAKTAAWATGPSDWKAYPEAADRHCLGFRVHLSSAPIETLGVLWGFSKAASGNCVDLKCLFDGSAGEQVLLIAAQARLFWSQPIWAAMWDRLLDLSRYPYLWGTASPIMRG
jgi:hypothetical protein